MADTSISERYGWPVNDWAKAAGISRASVFNLIAQNRIASVKFLSKRIITTHPRDFLSSLSSDAGR